LHFNNRVSTGIDGFDEVIDMLRLGDNVVWQVDSVKNYKTLIDPFINRAILDRRKIVYVRFGRHEPLLETSEFIKVCPLDASKGFEYFASAIHTIAEEEGPQTFYVFDCLTDLLSSWRSDLMIGNFFRITCPHLYELDTVAYFAILRSSHTDKTIAGIRETTQLLLDQYFVNGKFYIHPLKVWQRYSPTMFLPHMIVDKQAVCITASSDAAELFSGINRNRDRLDYWDKLFNKAKAIQKNPKREKNKIKNLLMEMIIGSKSRMFELCRKYLDLSDILSIYSREIGTGFIGGKSIGMILARKILESSSERFSAYMEPHDSYYLGSDIYYSYIVQNGWWELRTKQKTKDGYFAFAPELQEKLMYGKFPSYVVEEFIQMLEYFGQSPIIVRSSSLLEDNFGNAFAGKYESVFCVNQGSPEERYTALENAVRTVYASTMNEDALAYRMNRGLFEKDEQMAILIQRVSGNYYEDKFFPHIAGVGNSSNLYVWDDSVDMNAGMLRLVFGLGTRAVERTVGDYAKIVCLDNPLRNPPISLEDKSKYTQKNVDVLLLKENTLSEVAFDNIVEYGINVPLTTFAQKDYLEENRLRELGYYNITVPYIIDFKNMLTNTEFPTLMKDILAILSKEYEYPVDIEFTGNFLSENDFKINLLQCRPLQTRGLGRLVELPDDNQCKRCFFSSKGNFMGGNIRLKIDYVIFIDASKYLQLKEEDKYDIARIIGAVNLALKGKTVMLIGPGRWGTTTPSLGVPVHFSEICNMSVICEVASTEAGFMPELSYGSHFFQDLVESGIFYAAIFDGRDDVTFHPENIFGSENLLGSISPRGIAFQDVIYIYKPNNMEIFSDIVSQRLICI